MTKDVVKKPERWTNALIKVYLRQNELHSVTVKAVLPAMQLLHLILLQVDFETAVQPQHGHHVLV